MTAEQTLLQEIEESQKSLGREKQEGIYKRDLKKRIEVLNWVLQNMKNPETNICALIETKMNQLIDEINAKDSILESDPLDSDVRILDWILYVVCSNE
jgi:transcriptional regulator of aromatic amino acid metabolism